MPTPFAKTGDDDCCYCSKTNQSIRFPPIQTSQKWNIVLPNLSNYSYLENDAASKYGHNVHKSTQHIVNCNLEPTLSLSPSISLLTFLPQRVIWGCTWKSSIFLKLQESSLFPLSRTSCIHSDQATHPKEPESSFSAVLLFAILARWVRWRLGNPPVLFWPLINYYLIGSDQFLSIFVTWMPFTIFESSPRLHKLFLPTIPDGRTWRTGRTRRT